MCVFKQPREIKPAPQHPKYVIYRSSSWDFCSLYMVLYANELCIIREAIFQHWQFSTRKMCVPSYFLHFLKALNEYFMKTSKHDKHMSIRSHKTLHQNLINVLFVLWRDMAYSGNLNKTTIKRVICIYQCYITKQYNYRSNKHTESPRRVNVNKYFLGVTRAFKPNNHIFHIFILIKTILKHSLEFKLCKYFLNAIFLCMCVCLTAYVLGNENTAPI